MEDADCRVKKQETGRREADLVEQADRGESRCRTCNERAAKWAAGSADQGEPGRIKLIYKCRSLFQLFWDRQPIAL
jgi:hypothetical protein